MNQRQQNEQNKISQGVSSGSLTTTQGAHLQNAENRIQQQEASDLAKNNGHLTGAEDRQLNREENRVNRRINADEHKGPGGGGPKGAGKHPHGGPNGGGKPPGGNTPPVTTGT